MAKLYSFIMIIIIERETNRLSVLFLPLTIDLLNLSHHLISHSHYSIFKCFRDTAYIPRYKNVAYIIITSQ